MNTDKLTNQALKLYHIIRVASNEARVYSDRKGRLCALASRAYRRLERRRFRFLIKPDGVGRSSALLSGVLGQGGTQ